ncbi:hypothetical protein L1049_023471 [Liquidambar formosana]|uniref:Uncharacterized protein n=1 Tax=Liquidambar formosana TaxID=63359 RepID=A0AAP0S036_LIQFO
MVTVSRQELLKWYLVALKLNATIEAKLQRMPNPSLELPKQSKEAQLQELQQQPLDSPQNVIKGDNNNLAEGGSRSDSKWVISIRENLKQARPDDEKDVGVS